MIKFDQFKLYTQQVDGVRYLLDPDAPFVIFYFSENSSLLEDYHKLNIRSVDVRYVVVPVTKVPRTFFKPEDKKKYRQFKLTAYSTQQKIPSHTNVIVDISNYIEAVEHRFKPLNWRTRYGNYLTDLVDHIFSQFPSNYKKVFIYSVNSTKSLPVFANRKIFQTIQQLKSGDNLLFDYMMLATVNSSSTRYRLLMKNKDYKFNLVYNWVKNIRIGSHEPVENDNELPNEHSEIVQNASKDVMDNIDKTQPEMQIVDKPKVHAAISSFLSKDRNTLNKVNDKENNDEDNKKIAIASILYKVNGDLEKSKKISNKIPPLRLSQTLVHIEKKYKDELMTPQPINSTSEEDIIKSSDVKDIVNNKVPSHLFKKRQIDFAVNLKKDSENSFNVLNKTDLPLKVEKIELIDKPTKNTELNKTDMVVLKTTLIDSFGNSHQINIDLPRIDEYGTFRVNGKRKCLINQIVLNPITFPEEFDSRFTSSYSSFHIWSKRSRKLRYLEIYMANYTLPYSICTFFLFGFEKTLKDYDIHYEIVDSTPTKLPYTCLISPNRYIVFSNVNTPLKEEFCESFTHAKIIDYKVLKQFGTKEYFNDLIIKMTGRTNATYALSNNKENLIDPVVEQVLANKQMPIKLDEIMKFMAIKVIEGYTTDRNSLDHQRIRNSEVLIHLIQKQVHAAYTVYKEQVLAGNKNAKFTIPQAKILSDFINSEIVTDIEFANPIEEMSTMTRMSPVGKAVGGIPSKEAIQVEARNVHDSYFGNIDPLDTPEGANIGIVQHLTVNAALTSSRGLIHTKPINDNEKAGILSTSSCLIPFIENNDGARVMMAVNQARQALPLKNPEPPVVQSGYESLLTNVLSDNYIKRSPIDGVIDHVSNDLIVVKDKAGRQSRIGLEPVYLKSGSGKDTLSIFVPKVKINQHVKIGTVIAEGSSIAQGTIAMGRTLCVAVMPYKGYNFEDGVVINERLIKEDKLTSVHGIEEEVLISDKDRLLFISKIGDMTYKGEPLLRKTIGELEQFLGYSEEEDNEDIEMHGGQFIKKSPGGMIVDIDVFSNVPLNKFPLLKGLEERTNKRHLRVGQEKFTVSGRSIEGVLVKFKVQQELKIGLGDKLANRHGNKGIISLIEKDEDMPKTPWGESIDMIINPVGILGRMNMGQLYEIYIGLIARSLATKMVQTNDQKKSVEGLRKVLPLLDNTKNKMYSTKLIAAIENMSDVHYKEMINQIKKTGFVPIVIPPFQAPTNIQIKQAMNVLGLKAGYKIRIPEYNTSTMNEVPIGYMYIQKLEQIGEMKIYSRSTGPVTGKTLQPTSGKKREGGQKLGEMDTYSLISYNCPILLSEMLGPLSDDAITKNEIISDIIHNGSAKYRDAKIAPIQDLVKSYFTALMLTQ